jgi:hypothetical protein
VPTTYKVLGQIAAASAVAATETIYQAGTATGTATQSVISTVTVCNRGATSTTYRLAVRPDGTAVNNQHYIAYDATIPANDTIALTLGITLDGADILACYAGNASLTFNAYGCEITA